MKKLLPIAVFLLAFCLASCNKPAGNLPEGTTAASASEPAETAAATTTFATIATLDEWITLPTTAVPETETTTAETVTTAPPVRNPFVVTTVITLDTIETEPPRGIYDESKLKLYTDKATYKSNEKGTLKLENLSYDGLYFGPSAKLYFFDSGVWNPVRGGVSYGETIRGVLFYDENEFGDFSDDLNLPKDFEKHSPERCIEFSIDFNLAEDFVKLSPGKYRFEMDVDWTRHSESDRPKPVALLANFEIVE